MKIKHNLEFPHLPFSVPVGKKEEMVINDYISGFFWKHFENLYDVESEKKKGGNLNYRTRVGSLLQRYNNSYKLEKLKNYKDEGSVHKSYVEAFSSKCFYPVSGVKKAVQVNDFLVGARGSIDFARKVWFGVLEDIKKHLPEKAYKNHLLMFFDLYKFLITNSKKHSKIALDLWNLIPVQKSKEGYLNLISKLDLEDSNVRVDVVKKIDDFRSKDINIVDTLVYLRNIKVHYSEFNDFLDIYKNFDKGFTKTIIQENMTVTKIRVSLSEMMKTFPILSRITPNKNYNHVLEVFYYVVFSMGNEIIITKKFGVTEKDSSSREAYFVMMGDGKIQGVPITEIMEEVFLFIVEKKNDNPSISDKDLYDFTKVFLVDLLLNLTIPTNDLSLPKNVVKF